MFKVKFCLKKWFLKLIFFYDYNYLNLILLIGNVCDENDCQDDYDEIDDVIVCGGLRFVCRYCFIVFLLELVS